MSFFWTPPSGLGRHPPLSQGGRRLRDDADVIAVHSSGELGIQLATMLHLGRVLPILTLAGDAHYHHLEDDVIDGGKLAYGDGAIDVPDGPGLGVSLDPDRVARYPEAYKQLGNFPYDRDLLRPDLYALVPNTRWADPTDDRVPSLEL